MLYALLTSAMLATCPAHLTLLVMRNCMVCTLPPSIVREVNLTIILSY
jgi:hypothetical protein